MGLNKNKLFHAVTRKFVWRITLQIPCVTLMYCGISTSDSSNITQCYPHQTVNTQREQLRSPQMGPFCCWPCVLVCESEHAALEASPCWPIAHLEHSLPNTTHFLSHANMFWLPDHFSFTSFWNSALQLLLLLSMYCLTAFLSFLLASCDWKNSNIKRLQNSALGLFINQSGVRKKQMKTYGCINKCLWCPCHC